MTPQVPQSHGEPPTLPQQVILLGQALAPVTLGARRALSCPVEPSGQAFAVPDDLSRHMGIIQQALTHLSSTLTGAMTDLLANKGAGALEVGRCAGRIEQVLSEFGEGYIAAKSSTAAPEDEEARLLLLGVYRRHIRDICRWLDELVAVSADPTPTLVNRGMDPSVPAHLTITLNMTTPPQMARLHALAIRLQQPEDEGEDDVDTHSSPEPQVAPRPGPIGIIGALAAGVGLYRAVRRRFHR